MRKITIVLLGMIILGAGCARAPAAQPPAKPEAVVDALLQASARGDADTCLSLLMDDIVFRQEPPGVTVKGKTEFAALLKNSIAWHPQYSITSPIKVNGDRVTFSAKVSSDEFRIIGLEYITSDLELQIQEGKIKSWLSMPGSEDFRRLAELTAGGIGVTIEAVEQGVRIKGLASNSPAYEAGIRPGDVIIAVNGVSYSRMREGEMQLRVRGPVGSKVLLTIIREGTTTPTDIEVTRVSFGQLRY